MGGWRRFNVRGMHLVSSVAQISKQAEYFPSSLSLQKKQILLTIVYYCLFVTCRTTGKIHRCIRHANEKRAAQLHRFVTHNKNNFMFNSNFQTQIELSEYDAITEDICERVITESHRPGCVISVKNTDIYISHVKGVQAGGKGEVILEDIFDKFELCEEFDLFDEDDSEVFESEKSKDTGLSEDVWDCAFISSSPMGGSRVSVRVKPMK